LYRAESDDIDGAIDSIETCVLLGDKLSRQPTVVAGLVGIAVTGIGQANALVVATRGKDMRVEHFERLERVIASPKPVDSVYSTWCEALMAEEWISELQPSASQWPQVARSGNSFGDILGYTEFIIYVHTPVGEVDRRDNRRLVEAAAQVVRGHGTIEDKEKKLDALEVPEDFFNRFRLLSAFGVANLSAQELLLNPILSTRQNASATAVRVLKFRSENGRLPTMDEFENVIRPLPDPLGDGKLKYKETDLGYRVYGVGRNREDDGGVSRSESDGTSHDEVVDVKLAASK
jgi:hypothetical protein